MKSMPSALAITRSSGVVMKPRTRSAFAPTYTVVTCTTAISLRGYCRTLSERIDCRPAIRITKLTTIARTGRFMNKSVNFMLCPRLAIRRFRSWIVLRLNLIVDCDGSAIAQLEHARGHHLVPRIYAGYNRHLVTAGPVYFYKLLPHAPIRLSF